MLQRLLNYIKRWWETPVVGAHRKLALEGAVSEHEAGVDSGTGQMQDVQAVAERVGDPAGMVMPYDEHLLERAKTQWQFGDWESLSKLTIDSIKHHPERAKLALLAAAGRLQSGQRDDACRILHVAEDWGVNKQLLSRILISGVHNSIGRAAISSGQALRAASNFESAMSVALPGCDAKLLAKARNGSQLEQLGTASLTSVSNLFPRHAHPFAQPASGPGGVTAKSSRSDEVAIDLSLPSAIHDLLGLSAAALRSHDIQAAFAHASSALNKCLGAVCSVKFATTSLIRGVDTITILHVENDYIPKKISETQLFYEQDFLDLLRDFHREGGTFIDVGANIGNHSLFFACVVGAPVISIEPVPHNFVCLSVNLASNAATQDVKCLNVALGNSDGHVALEMGINDNYGSFTSGAVHNPMAGSDTGCGALHVRMTTLDNALALYFDKGSFPSIIKIDVEGMEIQVLRGAELLLERFLPVVAVECFTHALFVEVESELKRYDYFPLAVKNATPTFTFVSRRNQRHLQVLEQYLRQTCVKQAARHKTFL